MWPFQRNVHRLSDHYWAVNVNYNNFRDKFHVDDFHDDDAAASASTVATHATALALIGLAGFFLVRQKKKKASGPVQQPFVSQYYPPHMDRASQGGDPDYDQTHRSSAAKSPMNFATGSTSPEYQPQPVFEGTNKSMTSAPGYASGYNVGQPVEMQGQQSL
ncbi:hypothetical protein MGU_08231 [Metarhizium guizhouense ARSEF 977]|uniref:Uncharacterized protein n=1 Tax=Metarhizium guizhouense (strain ARSEF 977) TaxID=1276136 RepID=A0A0B4GY08_METGA|nr:hypothetical protein MGU_08231 [Metarhizium guizhouense ARSEF 977]